jgi:hypothetical protein
VGARGGVSKIRSLSARRYPDIAITVELADKEEVPTWEYQLRFSQDNLRRPTITGEKVMYLGASILDRPLPEDKGDPERLGQTYLEQVNVNKDFRAVADFFRTIRYLHIVPQLVREPERSVGRRDDPFGGDFLEQISQTQERTLRSRLGKIADALKVAVPQLEELELWKDDRGTPHLRGRYEHWRPRGAWQTEEQFSDGTLRLLGLLWATLDGIGPLLLEEPELSLHPEVVRFIPQMFARLQRRTGRQFFVSTHSTDLLRDSGIGLDEVLLLAPESEGTSVHPASDLNEILLLLEGGLSLAEAVVPAARPMRVEQLSFFGDDQ